jgi:BirA family transcriptional regulator, biotin operon repressor / biotin---[acetyl-CoA-carboxylase] ligase
MLGRRIIQIESVDSTNNYATNLIKEGKLVHGTVIMAEQQTKGKGQRGAEWLSEPFENLIFSLFLCPVNLTVSNQKVLTQIASLAVIRTLDKVGVLAQIKWPNDVLVQGKKIAGILIENQLQGADLSGSIVGIGLNVNQTDFGTLNATSVQRETQAFNSINSMVYILLHELNLLWRLVENYQFEEIQNNYLDRLWRLNTTADFRDRTGCFQGVIKGVSERGLLLLERQGEVHQYDLKEIEFL